MTIRPIFTLILIATSLFVAAPKAEAVDLGSASEDYNQYTVLEPVPTREGNLGVAQEQIDAKDYIERIYLFSFTAAILLAVIMIIWAGVEYTAAGISLAGKKDAKERITAAIGGLILALFSYLLLETINPDLVSPNITAPDRPSVGGGPGGTSGPGPVGGVPTSCTTAALAAAYNTPTSAPADSPALASLRTAIRNEWTKRGLSTTLYGSTYTYDVDFSRCNYTRGHTVPSCNILDCSHSRNSKHYPRNGVPDIYLGSNAIDYGMGKGSPDNSKQYGDTLLQIAQTEAGRLGITGYRGFCESPSHTRVECSSGNANHIHIEIGP